MHYNIQTVKRNLAHKLTLVNELECLIKNNKTTSEAIEKTLFSICTNPDFQIDNVRETFRYHNEGT